MAGTTAPVSVGQLVFLGSNGNLNTAFIPPPMTIYGINGVGIDHQATNVSRLWNRTLIAATRPGARATLRAVDSR